MRMNQHTETQASEAPSSADSVQIDAGTGSFERSQIDWRIWLGILVTGVWLLVLTLYISGAVGWFNLGNVPMDTLGSFLEGSFAPLAFLWFVLAYYSQQKELAQNTEALRLQSREMKRSVEQAKLQAEAIAQSEVHARRDAFIGINNIVRAQLGNILGFLYISSQGASGSGEVPQVEISKLWSSNDPEAFAGKLLELSFSRGSIYGYKVFWGTEIRTKHCHNFIFAFERLLATASECGDGDMIRDAVAGTTHGHVYKRMIEFRESPPEGITHGVFDFDPDSET